MQAQKCLIKQVSL